MPSQKEGISLIQILLYLEIFSEWQEWIPNIYGASSLFHDSMEFLSLEINTVHYDDGH